jgi:hypothetical protein
MTSDVNGAVNASVNQAFCTPFTQNDLGVTRHYSLYLSIQRLVRNLCRKKTKIIAFQALLGRKPFAVLNSQRHSAAVDKEREMSFVTIRSEGRERPTAVHAVL